MRRLPGYLMVSALVLLAVALPSSSFAQEKAEDRTSDGSTTVSGTFVARWGDPRSGSEPRVEYGISTTPGAETELVVDAETERPDTNLTALSGERVQVTGQELPGERIAAEEIDPLVSGKAGDPKAAPTSRPTATIMCRFSDSPAVTPREKPYFDGLLGGTKPGMDHYFRELSFGNVNLTGSKTYGWYNLKATRASYFNGSRMDLNRLAQDCTSAADASVNFPAFTNINMMFNQDLDCCAWGGGNYLKLDGQSKYYSVTWMPPWAFNNQYVLGHEMGHSFGLPHSSGPYGETYDSDWDPMSDGSVCRPRDATYGCVGVHTISYHKKLLEWIPQERVYKATADSARTIDIEPIDTLASSGYMMAEIPISGSSTRFYTVEARRFAGYDTQIPGEAVVIHSIDTNRSVPAQVIDETRDGDTNDEGSQWLPGETFTDAISKISVQVLAKNPNGGYRVRISTGTVRDNPPNTRPSTRITSKPPLTTKLRTARFGFASTEPGSTFRCSLDGRSYTTCPRTRTYKNLKPGVHTLRVYAVGTGGTSDRDATPASHRWKIVRR